VRRKEAASLVLASSSPRRRELLGYFGIAFTVKVPDVDESVLPKEDPVSHVRRLAQAKAAKVAQEEKEGLVVGADTVVVLDGEIIGKPGDREDAIRMLAALAGRTHRVYSGVAVIDLPSGATKAFVICSRVTMAPIAESEIRRYVDGGEPLDKAGAYAVQGEGKQYVTEVRGSFTNVVGLPLQALHRLLCHFRLPVSLPETRL
jgi:septum formation protein